MRLSRNTTSAADTLVRLCDLPLHGVKRTITPAVDPVAVEEVKAQLRIAPTNSSEDSLIDRLIKAATRRVERYTGRSLMTQTWTLPLDFLPFGGDTEWWNGTRDGALSMFLPTMMELPKPPLQSVTSIVSYADDNTATTFSTSNYFVDTVSDPGRISLRLGSVWPIPTRQANGLIFTFVGGYGNVPDSIPADLRHGLLVYIADLYEHRDSLDFGEDFTRETANLPWSAKTFLDAYRVEG